MLTLWVGFLLLSYLQPCCEALASGNPQGSQAGAVSAGGEGRAWSVSPGGPPLADADGGPASSPRHGQCVARGDLEDRLPAVVTGRGPQVPDSERTLPVPVSLALRELPPSPRHREPRRQERGPPAPVYLTTLRLRL